MSEVGVAALTREIADVGEELRSGQREWDARRDMLHARKADLEEARRLCLVGISPAEQDLAKQVIYVRGPVAESAGGALSAAVFVMAAGGGGLRSGYIGAKRYGGFHQRCDCEYGYGPKHGGIVFEVGLTPDTRQRLRDGDTLTEAECDAAAKYLMALARTGENDGE